MVILIVCPISKFQPFATCTIITALEKKQTDVLLAQFAEVCLLETVGHFGANLELNFGGVARLL